MIGSDPQASDLPDGWGVASIGELNAFSSGTVNPATRPDEVFELYSVPSFPAGRPDQLPGRAIGSTKQTVRPDDVLVCKINPRINRVWTVGPRSDHEQIASSEWIGFRSDALVPRFAKHYFSEPSFRSLLCSEVSGVGGSLTRAQPSRVAEYPVLVAPLAEQTRIANQLDTLLARIQACQDRLEAIPALLKRFRQAVLNSAVSGKLTEVEDGTAAAEWKRTTVGAIALDVRYGTSKKCTYAATGHGVLRIPNIAQHGRIDLTDLKRADFDAQEVEKLALREGDLLVIRSNGSVDLVGACSVVTSAEAGLLFAGYLMRLRVDPSKAFPAYVRICLAASSQRELIERTAKSTSGVNNLNAEELRSLPLSLPTVDEQTAIVNRVESLFKLAARIEGRYAAAASNALRLTPLTLAKAFRGELAPQDPNDEPASALLARIAAQRNAPTDGATARTPRRGRPPRAPNEASTMTKSRQDDDVMGQPYLASHLRRIGTPASAETLFKASELPVADFYKQLAWEVAKGHVKDNQTTLEPGHAAG